MSTETEQHVILGRIVGLFGVRGWVKVFSYTDPRQAILDYDRWWLRSNGNETPVDVREGKRHGKAVIAALDGFDDRDAAAGLLDAEIVVPRSLLPEPRDGEYYWADLEGLEVINRDGRSLGRVDYVLETGANDVLVVKGDVERLIPFVLEDVISDVNLADGVIRVDWEWD